MYHLMLYDCWHSVDELVCLRIISDNHASITLPVNTFVITYNKPCLHTSTPVCMLRLSTLRLSELCFII